MSRLTEVKNAYLDHMGNKEAEGFMEQLYASDLYVPFELYQDEKTHEMHRMSLPAARILHADGKAYRCLLAFSDPNEVEDEWSKQFAWTTMRVQQLIDLTNASDIVNIALDPLTDALIITPSMVHDYQAGWLKQRA